MNDISPLINAREAINKKNAILVDARGGGDAYDRYLKGHLENAFFVNLEYDLSSKTSNPAYGGRHPLPAVETFASLLGKLGINPSAHVITYDDKAGANSATRFWWMMKAVGHERVQVIDGGLSALVKEGVVLSTQTYEPISVGPYPVKEWKLPTVDMDFVAKAVNDPNYLVIDVREGYRFRGESEPIDLTAGHIPGAVNVPYIDNLTPEGNYLSVSMLSEKYRTVIDNRSLENVIVHCGSGVTACHTLLAMEHAGIKGAKLYVGSWGEWSRRSMPIATEGEKQ